MLYRFLKITLPVFYRVFFRRVHLSGLENIPADKPVFLAANHSNSFLDGVMISALLKRKVHILVRGDVFNKSWASKVLRSMNLLPIFRQTDGSIRDNIRKNNELADQIYELFRKNRVVLIFSEAIARCEKRQRPIKKGTARMAFDMELRTGFKTGLYVVPTGINYTAFRGFRKELMIHFGPAIEMREWKEEYAYSKGAAVSALTDDIAKRMKDEMVIIENEENDEVADQALRICRNDQPVPMVKVLFKNNKRLSHEIKVADKLNERFADENDSLKQDISRYEALLSENKIDDIALSNSKGAFADWLIIILLCLPALIGFVIFGWMFKVSWKKTVSAVKRPEFFDSVLYGITFIFAFPTVLILFVVLLILCQWIGLAIWIGLIGSGFCYLIWSELVHRRRHAGRWNKLQRKSPETANEMTQLRGKIASELTVG